MRDSFYREVHFLLKSNNSAMKIFKNREKLEDFYSRILRIQQKTNLSVETVSHKRILFQYMKVLSKSNTLKAFVAPNITDIVTFVYNNITLDIYKRVNIHGVYRYL